MDILERMYYSTKLKNICYYEEAKKVFDSLEGVKVIALKGLHLAEKIYKDIALRPFGDIDILVDKKDKKKVDKALSKLGYNVKYPTLRKHLPHLVRWSPKDEEVWNDIHRYKGMVKKVDYSKASDNPLIGSFNIEVKNSIRFPTPWHINTSSFFRNAIPMKIASRDIFVLSLEENIIYLCSHLHRHTLFIPSFNVVEVSKLLISIRLVLYRFCDINEILNLYKNQINWERFQKIVKTQKLNLPVYYSLYFTEQLFGKKVPEDIMTKMKPNNFDKLKNIRLYYWRPLLFDQITVHRQSDFTSRLFNYDYKSIREEGFNEALKAKFKPEKAKNWNRTIQFVRTGPEEGYGWYITIKNEKVRYNEGLTKEPDITIEIPFESFCRLFRWDTRDLGRLDLTKMAKEGKIKVIGELADLEKIQEIF